ncbi:putative ribonuclease H protein [Sesamum angolense]|uniref:Ribonuclease H protein n=1 Tax=Sesamum angolense TaxID=2727404 RepID=A0AAE1T871_9LAMI|nr:putative ribonuclease H protein [Sesamum angolense]
MVSKPMAKDAVRTVQHKVPEEDETVDMEIGIDVRSYIDKGKAPFGTFETGETIRWQLRLVNEFRLNFFFLNSLNVCVFNPLPQWSWFTDLICLLLSFMVLMILSVDGGWQSLETLADSISDEPWIVGGDFNSVVDMRENSFLGIIAVKEIVAYGNVWIDCWLMMLGYDYGRIRIINVLTLGLPITPHLCRGDTDKHTGTSLYAVTRKLRALKPVFRTLRKKKGDLSVNVKLAAEFLATVQQLLQIDRHNSLLLHLEKCCKLIFFKATKLEQVMLQQRAKIQWLKGGDQCSRIFFRKVAMRRASKRVFQIINEDGHTLTTQEDVVNEFVSFYQRLLGGDRRREFIDLRYLRPWTRHVLTQEESQALVQSVTREEIKDAFFDIAEDKAPGPDGYSSGRLLKQVNTTILALIPKRLRLVLDKLISQSQNAFVPGRSIGDNILLAQELFAGYNRQGLPMRCALKVDLRKAYDTVEWDFLTAVLQLFGFRKPLLDGLRSVSLLLCSRMRDSPSIGGARRLDYSNFALQMTSSSFCKADVDSVRVFRHGLDEFAKLSGLHANPQKSQLILSHSAQDVREHLLAELHFQEGHLPLRYLGLPLLASRLSISDCKPLLLKIDSRIKGWESIQLSFAGRLQLIKSVLMSLKVYWAMTFILPKGVIREVEKKMRTFLWKENSAVGYPKVAWSVVCKPIEEGGQGIRDILALNKALMSRHLWNVIQNNQSSIWVK